MPIRIVETHGPVVIGKIINQKGEPTSYITMPKDYDGKDVGLVNPNHESLTAARGFLGITTAPKRTSAQKAAEKAQSKPKMRSLPQSTKGYQPDSGKGGKK